MLAADDSVACDFDEDHSLMPSRTNLMSKNYRENSPNSTLQRKKIKNAEATTEEVPNTETAEARRFKHMHYPDSREVRRKFDIPEESLIMQQTNCQNKMYLGFERCTHCIKKQTDSCRFSEVRAFGGSSRKLTDGPYFKSYLSEDYPPPKAIAFQPEYVAVSPEADCLYIQRTVSDEILHVLEEDLAVVQRPDCVRKFYQKEVSLIKRQLCDICLSSIFNAYWVCCVCGQEICLNCYEVADTKYAPKTMKACTYRRTHCNENRFPVNHLGVKEILRVKSAVSELRDKRNQEDSIENQVLLCSSVNGLSPVDMAPQSNSSLKTDTLEEYRMSYLSKSVADFSIAEFQNEWRQHRPLSVYGLESIIDKKLWHPNWFIEELGNEDVEVLDCFDGATVYMPQTVLDFFDGYYLHPGALIWKLKDWPSDQHFKDKFPLHYQNFLEMLPFKSYSGPCGSLNLACRLPEKDQLLDLGPKMYNAYGSYDHIIGAPGTTNLHLDMADAVNIMVYAVETVPDKYDVEYASFQATINKAAEKHMRKTGVLYEKKQSVAAVWDIFRVEDLPKIREYLSEYAEKEGIRVDDPVHDQSFYLNQVMLRELFDMYKVKSYRIYQNPGTAVFVPAGSAHQVCNYQACIKVALDFVSPENVARCRMLTQEFRQLGGSHKRKEDLLGLKRIIYYSWRSCELELHQGPKYETEEETIPEEKPKRVNRQTRKRRASN